MSIAAPRLDGLLREHLCQRRLHGPAGVGVDGVDAGVAELLLRVMPDLGHEQRFAIGEHAAHRVARVFVLALRVALDVPSRDQRGAPGGDVEHEKLAGLSEMQIDGGPVAARDCDADRGRGGDGFSERAFERFGGHGVLSRCTKSGKANGNHRASWLLPANRCRGRLARHSRA